MANRSVFNMLFAFMIEGENVNFDMQKWIMDHSLPDKDWIWFVWIFNNVP